MEDGEIQDIRGNEMDQSIKAQKIQQIIKLLKFILTIDDMEILKSTIESVVEMLGEISEEQNN